MIDGYATLFAEAAEQASFDVLLVPVGVGSLAAAAARFGAQAGATVIGVEPVAAACLTASLAAGEPTRDPDAGHDDGRARLRGGLGRRVAVRCATASTATVTVDDDEVARGDARAGRRRPGDRRVRRRAAGRAARARVADPARAALRERSGSAPASRVLLIATEGPTDPDAYAAAVA